MGNSENKLNYRESIIQLNNIKDTPKYFQDEFWKQFWPETQLVDKNELFTLVSCAELRALREEKPQNFTKLIIYCSEQLISCSTNTFCNTFYQQNVTLNCCRLLIRILPYVFEDEDFSKLFLTNIHLDQNSDKEDENLNKKQSLSSESDLNNEENTFINSKLNKSKKNIKNNLKKNKLFVRLINAICDLLFCPEFTVIPAFNKNTQKGTKSKTEPDTPPIELSEIDSCEFIWQSGVGFTASHLNSSNLINFNFTNTYSLQNIEKNRIDLLQLLLVLFSKTMYKLPEEVTNEMNECLHHFTSSKNRHCLALFTSILNTVLAYKPNSSYFSSFYNNQNNIDKEQLVELCLQIMIVCLDYDFSSNSSNNQNKIKNFNLNKQINLDSDENMSNDYCSNMLENNNSNINNHNTGFNADDNDSITSNKTDNLSNDQTNLFYSNFFDLTLHENLFINYLARLHREKDFQFILNGFVNLLNIPIVSTYLSNYNRKIQFHQELLILFWKFCDLNKKFLFYTLKSSKIIEILTPILYHLNESRGDPSKLGLIHIGIFIILLLSGERNFGVRLNKPFNNNLIIFKQIPIFSGTYADLLIIVFHKLITTGSSKLQSLFECFLTIIVNISPYLKTLTMVSANKLLHFFEAFSTPWFLYCNENNHHLIFYLLEIFNNIIQYQFDGNSNLIYTIIRKRNCFHQLVNLPTDYYFICKSLNKSEKKVVKSQSTLTCKEIEYSKKKLTDINNTTDDEFTYKFTQSKSFVNNSNSLDDEKKQIEISEIKLNEIKLENEIQINEIVENEISKFDFKETKLNNFCENNNNEHKKSDDNNRKNQIKLESKSIKNHNAKQNNTEQIKKLNKYKKDKKKLNEISDWKPTSEWVLSWKKKMPLQTIMRMLQVLVPQVEKMCLDKGITNENEILKFLEHGTLVGLLPVPHPILIRKYQTNAGTILWFRTYMWGIIYLRNTNPSIWYNTQVKLFEIQKI